VLILEQDLKELLQSHGLKATPQRLIVLEYLIKHQTHPTAEQIHEDLENISLATVYNTLDKLVDSELVIAIK
jgi:Fe2+/Zn2+ uptake regulation proteins